MSNNNISLANQVFTNFDRPVSQISKARKKNFTNYIKQSSNMNKIIFTEPLILRVWENDPKFPAPGTPKDLDPLVGFASLSFTLENKTEQSIEIKLLAVEVYSIDNRKKIMSMPTKTIIIHPLEIAPQRYQLSNKTGYENANQVEAVIIYELDNQRYQIKSPPVKIPDS